MSHPTPPKLLVVALAVCVLAWPCPVGAQPAGKTADAGVAQAPAAAPAAGAQSSPPPVATPAPVPAPSAPAVPAPASAPAEATPQPAPEDDESAALRERAARIDALVRGRLEASVDADALLRWDVESGPAPELWVQATRAPKERELPENEAARAFVASLGRYLALPKAAKTRVLARHRKKHAAFEAQARQRTEMASELQTLQQGNQRLEAWLKGELDAAKSIEGLLELDLVPPDLPRLGDAEGTALRGELEAALARRAALVQDYAGLSRAQREALHAAHRARKQAIEDARGQAQQREAALEEAERRHLQELNDQQASVARQRKAALEAAARAKSEAQRLFASERARLLGDAQALGAAEAKLDARQSRLEVPREQALAYQRRVQALLARAALERHLETEADLLYAEIRSALGRGRSALRQALAAWRSSQSVVPEPSAGPDVSLLDESDRAELARMRLELAQRRGALRAREQELQQLHARALNDGVGRMNRSRLELLPLVSRDLRSGLLGFGPEGIEQLHRELDQMVLVVSYHLKALPQDARRLYASARNSTYAIVLALLQLFAALAVFRIWRVNGDGVLNRVELNARAAPLQTSLMRSLAVGAWYLRRIRQPLEWLLLLAFVFHVVGRVDELPEIAFLWIACRWVTIGWACVLFLDALAVRRHLGRRERYETPELRLATLRAIALMVVAGGLLLSWTLEGVGAGTVYRWVKVGCFLLATPLALRLAHRWREPVRRRLEDDSSESPTVKWVLRNQDGLRVYPATLVGAGYLMGQSFLRTIMRQAARFEWMQRALAYLFRVQVQRQAQAQRKTTPRVPLSSVAPLPMGVEDLRDGLVRDVATEQLEQAVAQVLVGGSLTIVVGERGIGRSTFLKRLTERLGEDLVLRVSCPSGEMADLEAELTRRAVAQTGASEGKTSVEALAQSPVQVVCVDDVQRMVKPAVGGLDAFERLVDLSQRHDTRIAWVFTVTSSAWSVVSRARDSVGGFDCVLRLPAWSEKQIGELLQQRTAAEGIEPSFEELTVPRQLDVEETLDPVERATLAYYRILWDFSDGNPTVALHFWRESLYRDADGGITVALFDTPSPRDIEALPVNMHFMLRAVIQLDRATVQAVAECTAYPVDVVRDGLELALRRGYVERVDEGELSITLNWFRTISTVLRRQHLLVS